MKIFLHLIGLSLFCFGCVDKSETETTQKAAVESLEKIQTKEKLTILFFGNSITAGYQLDMDDAFPAIIQRRLDSIGFEYRSKNPNLFFFRNTTDAPGICILSNARLSLCSINPHLKNNCTTSWLTIIN